MHKVNCMFCFKTFSSFHLKICLTIFDSFLGLNLPDINLLDDKIPTVLIFF